MSVFLLKLTALISMVIDHVGYVISLAAPGLVYTLPLRAIGRLAFPVYAFLIVNGMEKSHDRRSYLARLSLFALISQIPFSLAFTPQNYSDVLDSSLPFLSLNSGNLKLFPLAAAALLIYGLIFRRSAFRELIIHFFALLLPLFSICVGGVHLVTANLNVFYTLACSLAIITAADALGKNEYSRGVKLLLLASAVLAAFYVLPHADYGFDGLLLIVLIYLMRQGRWMQALFMALWSVSMYYFSLHYTLGALLASILVLFYKGKKGRGLKLGFYAAYPLHLILLFVLAYLFL